MCTNKELQVSRLLGEQNEDGSWDITIFFCTQIGKKIMQVRNSALAIAKQHPLENREHTEPLFATLVALEYLERHMKIEDKKTIFLTERARTFTNKVAGSDQISIWTEKAKWLFDGNPADNEVTICPNCNTKRPIVCKICATCSCRQNDPLLIKGILENEYKLDIMNPNAKIRSNINDVDWATIIGCHWIPGGLGSFGVVAIETPEGILVGKCAGNNYRTEYLSSKLALRLGLRTPASRLLSRDSEEGEAFLSAIQNAPFSNSQDAQRITKYKMFSNFIIMEFVPAGQTLQSNTPKQSQSWFAHPDFIPSLCDVMAFDIITNNYDRIPIVWQNTGNAKNAMIHESDGAVRLFCIDQFIGRIVQSFLFKYEKKVETILEVCSEVKLNRIVTDEQKTEIFSYLIDFFMCEMQIIITDEQLVNICEHLLISVYNMANKVKCLDMATILQSEDKTTKALYINDNLFPFVQHVATWITKMNVFQPLSK